jgi:acetyltransferase-like isoleucine patch superfamily enzyme
MSVDLFQYVDWLEPGGEFAGVGDESRKVYVETPLPDKLNTFVGQNSKNLIIGRRSFRTIGGHVSGNTVIGRYCAVSAQVYVGGGNHHMDWLTTGFVGNYNDASDDDSPPEVTVIGCDVWIGIGAIILAGVKVGHGSCIGAGSIITKDVPPYSVVVGNPGRVIRQRFDDKTVAELMETRWWELPHDLIETLPISDLAKSMALVREYRAKYPRVPRLATLKV